MTTLTIEIPEKVEKTLADLIEQLGGKVVSKESLGTDSAVKLSSKEKKFIREFEESIAFVNLHRQGKVKAKSIDELLNEL